MVLCAMERYIPDLYKPWVQFLHAGKVQGCSWKLSTPGKYLLKSNSPVENRVILGDFNAEI